MHNNLNILEMKQVLGLQSFIPNANRLNIWKLNNLSHGLKDNLSKVLTFSPQPTPNYGSSCEKVTGSNVINVLKGGSGGAQPPGAKTFLLVSENRRQRLDSPFCIITQHTKFEFGHQRQSKKISNTQELTMQLSQTLCSAKV